MKKTLILLMLLTSIFYTIFTQTNELQILLNQARVHENRNQISQALEIYESLYQQHPRNEDVVDAYLRVLLLRSNFEKARQIINEAKNYLPAIFIAKQEANYLIKTNEVEAAEKITLDWLQQNRVNANSFSEFARVFESATLFDTAVEIYELARSSLNNNTLFTLELSNAYYYVRNHEKFYEEAINFLRTNPGYLYFYRSRFKEFLATNPEHITIIDTLINTGSPNNQLLELLAFALVEVKDFQRAADIFEVLPLTNMIRFADDLKSDGYMDFALDTYTRAIDRATTPVEIADILYKIAEIHFEKNDIESCVSILYDIINNQELQENAWRNRSRVNTQARLLMALITMQNIDYDMPPDELILHRENVINWFDSASAFSNNPTEKAEIQFRLARYLYLNEEYLQAFRVIEQTVQGQRTNSNIYKMSYFPRYEIALFQNSAERDSLLTECIINFPEDPRITDMLYLETFLNELDNNTKPVFLNALRKKGLYQDSLAVEIMIGLAEDTKIEELYIFAFEWAINAGLYDIVDVVQNKAFQNSVLHDYVFLHTVRRKDNSDERRYMISDFLNNNPLNVFSPQLRGILLSL